tara:strand:+ start:1837 stop:2580 length:744 start_codon:yes stop_codon:yes gene_type:complete
VLTNKEIEKAYNKIKKEWSKNLKKKGVKLPRLKSGEKFSKDALVLVYLYKNINEVVSKNELTSFVRKFYNDTNDVQQARHLANGKGWNVISGTRHDQEAELRGLGSGDYMLVDLEQVHPNFAHGRRQSRLKGDDEWESIKKHYNYRCATCGSREGEANLHYPSSTTYLQQGHMDPNKPLDSNNTIPQCEKCNRPDRNYFVYNKKGRVIKISDPRFILKSNKDIQIKALQFLIEQFPGFNEIHIKNKS